VDLIGREAELALVAARLRDRRLVTLVGPGGIGKTAVARAALARCRDGFDEGGRFVDVTRVDSAAAVGESIAAQLGYTSYRALIDAPGDHSVLVVVDNCEHVVDAVAETIDELLEACRMPTVLATSRTALELPGETVVPIGPLALPPSGVVEADAVRLFVERARDAGVEVTADDVVAELCRRLDGVPLAIELAAARARAMAPTEILERLVAGLDVLDRPRRRGARRHQSLRAAIRWSYDLLDGDERSLFDRLSVFSGPFTGRMAHAVAGGPGATEADTWDVLDRLVATSMVVADPSGPTTWYRELDTLRAFARARLDERGERRAVEARLVDHVAERVAAIVTRGAARWSAGALAELLALYDNVIASLNWCLAEDDEPDRALLLVAALWGVIHQAHTEEIGTLAQRVLARWPDARNAFRPDAIATAATCLYMMGEHGRAVALAEEALGGAAVSPYAPATLRRALGQSRRATGDTAGACRWFGDGAVEARRLGLTALAVEADAARAQVLADLGRLDEALALVAAARDEAGAATSELAAVWARSVEGSILLRVDVERAATVLDEALATSRALGYAAGVSVNLRSLALAELLRGDVGAAAGWVLALLDELLGRGSTYELRLVFDAAAAVLARAGRHSPAADLGATALRLPVVSITASVGHELFPVDGAGGTVLAPRDAILATRAELGALVAGVGGPAGAADAGAADALAAADRAGVFRQVGDFWEIGFAGETTTVRATKGLADIGRLLAAPGREVHCLELIGATVAEGDTGEVLDPAARRAYEERVRELQLVLDEAEAAADRGRAERARAELDALVDQLVAGLGLGGRARRAGGAAERARSAVTQRIRSTMKRIDTVHPRLGRHLHSAVRTGTFCEYRPEEPVDWQLDAASGVPGRRARGGAA
jgi:predicted ATPase